MSHQIKHHQGRRKLPVGHRSGSLAVFLLALTFVWGSGSAAFATPFVSYFDAVVSTNDNSIGAFTYNAASNEFWTASFGTSGQIRNIAYNGSSWQATGSNALADNAHVTQTSWANYIVADNTQTTATPNLNSWSGSQAIVGGMALNPQPITINGQTHAAGTLMLMNHAGSTVDDGTTEFLQYTKRVYWYNMTETGTPTPLGNGTGVAPDPSTDYNSNTVVDWNDQFLTVLTHQDLYDVDGDGTSLTSSNTGRSFAFSSDGQSMYMVDSASHLGGIYKVDLTSPGNVTKVVDADSDIPDSGTNTEPAVVPTSVHNYIGAGAGDQIFVQGSAGLGNEGGLNAYLDDGTTFASTPTTIFTEAEFRDFADWDDSTPDYRAIAADASGNLYVFDNSTSMLFKYDTEGRFVKVGSEEEREAFQLANYGSTHGSVLDLQVRTNTDNGFPVTEVLYSDFRARAPVGILAYKTGDFDYDDDVDADDLLAFSNALRARGVANPGGSNHVYNLNGNSDGNSSNSGIANSIIDWKDVKILQQFVDIPNGDANFDGILDTTDLNIMRDNYFSLGGAADKTWADGDFASLDPFATTYDALAADANIVNLVDLELIADTWLNVLGQDNLTFADLDANGYAGQFRADVITAFNLGSSSLAAIPEPSTAWLLFTGIGICGLRRRHARQATT